VGNLLSALLTLLLSAASQHTPLFSYGHVTSLLGVQQSLSVTWLLGSSLLNIAGDPE